jgi:Na+/H+ antiporter NhaD/arsenite permease-like protein
MEIAIIVTFIIGYAAIAFEHNFGVNKAASALATGVICWTIYILSAPDHHLVNHQLMEHLGEIAGILFFLLGAMTIVEVIDLHDGFHVITDYIQTTNARKLLWIVAILTFSLSAVLDNLTTTIVIVSLLRKLIQDREQRLLFVGITIIAANAGGAWSPMGDVTTTMLWIGGQITALKIMQMVILPSLVCLLVPVAVVAYRMGGSLEIAPAPSSANNTTARERNFIFGLGISLLLFVPVFKTVTHLPPFMAILLGLGILWIATELIHKGKNNEDRDFLSAVYALRKADTPSILFFLGILLSISALQSTGMLRQLADVLTRTIGNETIVVLSIGLLSAIVDNVPLVAAAQGMYSLEQYPTDHFFWEFLAYTTGTGGSILIIGSAAGVAAMGMERIDFFWYLKRISLLALLGYFAGAAVYLLQFSLIHP